MFCLLIGFTHEYVLLSCHFYIHTLFTGSHHSILRHLKDDHEIIPILTSLLTLSHPAQERLATLRGSTSLPFTSGFFYFPQEPDKWKCCETGPTVFLPYPRRLVSLRRLHLLSQRQHFLHSYFEPATYRSADRRSPNWADQCLLNNS